MFCNSCGTELRTINSFPTGKSNKRLENSNFEITSIEKSTDLDNKVENPHFQKLKEIIKLKNGKLISKSYKNVKTHVIIQCEKGHRWKVTPDNIINGNTWCPICHFENLSKLFTQYSIKNLKEFAQSKGGDCLEERYLGWDNNHRWICEEGHEWLANPRNVIAGGTWCPYCAEEELYERVARGILEVLLNEKFSKIIPNWLNADLIGKPGGRRHLDGYSERLRIALEVHGIQHYKYEPFYHKGDVRNFIKQQEVDNLKRHLCAERGILLIEIRFVWDGRDWRNLEFNEIEEFYRNILKSNGICIPESSKKIDWIPFLSIHRTQDLILKLLAEQGEMNLTDIAGNLNINYKSAGRHLKGLISLGLINYREGKQNQKLFSVKDSVKDIVAEKVNKIPQKFLIERKTELTNQTEKDILKLLKERGGLTTEQISIMLKLSKRTVEGYIKSLELRDFVKYSRLTGMGQAHPKIWSINDQKLT